MSIVLRRKRWTANEGDLYRSVCWGGGYAAVGLELDKGFFLPVGLYRYVPFPALFSFATASHMPAQDLAARDL